MRRPRPHGPTVRGRVRSDPGLLVLIGLVVAVTTALTAAVAPLSERTADRAMTAAVRDAGPRGDVVATLPEGYDDPRGETRDPAAAVVLRQAADYARAVLPPDLAAVLRPGVATLTTPALQLLDAGPGRYLRLAYVDTPTGPPSVTYTRGRAPRAATDRDRTAGRPVQVAVSEAVADALGVGPGDRLPAEDEQHRGLRVRIAGVYVADDPDADAWSRVDELLHPTDGVSEGVRRVSGAALVTPESLPDLQLAAPADDLTHRIAFGPRPDLVTWQNTADLERTVVSLQTSAGLARGDIAWSSLLDRVLADGRGQVDSARGQAQVLLVGLLAAALLVLVLAAGLLVRRRAGPMATARERGASLTDVAAELLLESAGLTLLAAAAGWATARLLVGSVGWAWTVPGLAVALLAAPALGVALAARATGRRAPANHSARRADDRTRRLRRLGFEAAVLAVAVVSLVALRQRGVTGSGGDLTAAGAITWCTVSGALLAVRALPPAAGGALRAARRTAGSVRVLLAARLAEAGTRALPLVVVALAVAQLGVGVALATTEREGQAAGALLAVGGDARLRTAPDPALADVARDLGDSPGVRAAAPGRVEDGVPASSRRTADSVRLVVVDAAAYRRLLAEAALPDLAPGARLTDTGGARVPALLLGGDAGLREALVVRWDDRNVPLEVVGRAPQVEASTDPVVVVDAGAFAAAGALADPDTVWVVGPGAPDALAAVAGTTGSVVRYADVLEARRQAPLAAGLTGLAASSAVLLLILAVLAVVLAAAAEAPARAVSLGRLRALGLRDADVRRVLAGELAVPTAIAAAVGLGLGIAAAHATFGALGLELITGQPGPPDVVVPRWTPLVLLAPLTAASGVAAAEWRRLRRRSLARLLRA